MNNGKPKILIVAGTYPTEIQPFVTSHVTAMVELGWDVAVATEEFEESGWSTATEVIRSIPISKLRQESAKIRKMKGLRRSFQMMKAFGVGYQKLFSGKRSKSMKASAVRLLQIACEFGPDVIHAHFGQVGLICSPVSKALGVPLSISFHGDDLLLHEIRDRNPYKGYIDDATAIVYSDFMANFARERLNCKIVQMQFGVSEELFKPAPVPGKWPETIKLLVVGRLIKYKGQDTAIRALKILAEQYSKYKFELELVGDGPDKDYYEGLVGELELQRSVKFAGRIPNSMVATRYQESTIVLIPSSVGVEGSQETFSLVALEALASGKPIVATTTGALPETIGSGGILVSHSEPSSLAAGVSELMERELSAVASLAAKRAAGFSYSIMRSRYGEILGECAGLSYMELQKR